MNKISLNNKLYCFGMITLEGEYTFDEKLGAYTKEKIFNPKQPDYLQGDLVSIKFEKAFSNGIYKEYFSSGKALFEIPFIKIEGGFYPHGVVKRYYEGEDDITETEVHVLIEETSFINGTRIGLQKTYYTNGLLNQETMFENSGQKFYKTYYVTSSNLKEEVHPNWGKKYYESGELLAEWTSNGYAINGEYIEKYPDGSIKMKANYINGNRDGVMYKYFNNGKIMELWGYEKGKRRFVKKYSENGILKTEFLYDNNGIEITKNYYDKGGNLTKKKQ